MLPGRNNQIYSAVPRPLAGVPCGPIDSIDQMFDDAQVKHFGIAHDVPKDENRPIRLVGQPITLSRTPSRMAVRPPEFGEQTEEVLAEFGFGKDKIAELRQHKGDVTESLRAENSTHEKAPENRGFLYFGTFEAQYLATTGPPNR